MKPCTHDVVYKLHGQSAGFVALCAAEGCRAVIVESGFLAYRFDRIEYDTAMEPLEVYRRISAARCLELI